MNKAFVREADPDSRVSCPQCGSLGLPVGSGPLDRHLRSESRAKLGDSAWYCGYPQCDTVYFNQFEASARLSDLKSPVYPYDVDAPICACFGFCYDDVEADVADGEPVRIRRLLERSRSAEACCEAVSLDGQCCLKEVQRLYLKLRAG